MKKNSQSYQAIWTALLCFDAGILSAIISFKDYLLLAIPLLFAIAIWIPLFKKNRYKQRIIGFSILLLSLFTTLGGIVYMVFADFEFTMSTFGFKLLCISSGLLVFIWNMLVFSYRKPLLHAGLLILCMFITPYIADFLIQINSIKTITTFPYLIMIFWQTFLGLIMGSAVIPSKVIINNKENNSFVK
jgi:hypothetical protein